MLYSDLLNIPLILKYSKVKLIKIIINNHITAFTVEDLHPRSVERL